MNSKKLCEKILSDLFKDPEFVSAETKAHLESCEKCAAEFEKIKKSCALIKASAPAVPSMKEKVLSKIRDEKLTPSPVSASSRRHIPFGTISALAAVLAVGILVYKGDILDKINNASKSENEMIVCDQEADFSPETLISEWNSKTNGQNDSGSYTLADSANGGASYSESLDENHEQEAARVKEYSADADHDAEETEAEESSPEEAVNDSTVSEKDHLLSLLPPSGSGASHPPKAEGTQTAVATDDMTDKTSDNSMSDGTSVGGGISEKSPENIMMLNPGRGASGASGGASGTAAVKESTDEKTINDIIKTALGGISENSDAAEIYKLLAMYYPDRIPYDVFESADPAEYLAFVMSIDDFDTEYTENAFLGFCGKMLFESFNKSEIL